MCSGSVDVTPRLVIWAPLDPFFTESLDYALRQASSSPHFVVVESCTDSQRYRRWVVTAPGWDTIDGIKVSLKIFSDVWLDTAPPGEDHHG